MESSYAIPLSLLLMSTVGGIMSTVVTVDSAHIQKMAVSYAHIHNRESGFFDDLLHNWHGMTYKTLVMAKNKKNAKILRSELQDVIGIL